MSSGEDVSLTGDGVGASVTSPMSRVPSAAPPGVGEAVVVAGVGAAVVAAGVGAAVGEADMTTASSSELTTPSPKM